jgi:hypothetical protein
MEAHQEAWMRDEMADLWLGFARSDLEAWLTQAGLQDVCVAVPGHT